jgi:hypothetical protein
MAHSFQLTQLTRIPLLDENDQEVGHNWFIGYNLQTDMGNYVSQYTAEGSQLSEEPTEAEIETLILSLYGPGYDAVVDNS